MRAAVAAALAALLVTPALTQAKRVRVCAVGPRLIVERSLRKAGEPTRDEA